MNQYIARPASIPSQRDARALLVVSAIGAAATVVSGVAALAT